MANRHAPHDLVQMQSLPLEAKERMSTARIQAWFESWAKYTIFNKETGKERFVTHFEEPNENGCFVKKLKKSMGRKSNAKNL